MQYCWVYYNITPKERPVDIVQYDYKYLCQGLGHLTGLETRIYKQGALFDHYTPLDFTPDIVGVISEKIKDYEENVFYIENAEMLIFGVIQVKKDGVVLIVGPTAHVRPGKRVVEITLSRLGEPLSRLPDLQKYFSNMIPYPFENFLEILCFVNYSLNAEKLSASDLIQRSGGIARFSTASVTNKVDNEQEQPHNTFQAEKLLLSYVTTGNVEAVQAFFTKPPAGRAGTLAQNELRQRKNTFICAATLVSRAAVAGGMSSETAFALSDVYVQKVEMLNLSGDITSLSMQMVLDYTHRVEALKYGGVHSRLASDVIRFVLKNLSKKLTTDDIALALKMNRSYLCERFKQETGNTVGAFIAESKIGEAKRMLEISDQSISHISEYLSFSSQSYFQTVFKKMEGCTPKEYRQALQAG